MVDIARKAGVSQSAVSFVLGGGPRAEQIGAETAEKIRRIAKQLNFHPNHGALLLKGKRTGVIGALANNWYYFPLRPRFLAYLNHHADQRKLKLLTWQSDDRIEPIEQFVGESSGHGIDGLIYLAFDNDGEWPAAGPLLGQLPHVVSVLGDPGIPGGSAVLCDVADGARQVVEHLHLQGRQKIVQIVDSLDLSINRQRQKAFCRVLNELGRPAAPDQLCVATRGWNEADLPKFVELAQDLVQQRKADAIWADNDMGAALLVRALVELGLRVPEDVAVVGWGNEMIARYTTPALTTVAYRLAPMMDAALDLLLEMIEAGEESVGRSVTIRPELIVRASA